jgi:phosphohistidine phosphatase
MRHAKSDWDADYGTDHERPLNDRGIRSSRIMGRVLMAEGHAPDHVVASTAVRARSTASLAKEAGEWSCEIVLDQSLYGGGADAAVLSASAVTGSEQLMLVGHQPTWSILFSVLTGESVEMKTATVAVIDFDIDRWKELPSVKGAVAAVYQPRDYYDTVFDRS